MDRLYRLTYSTHLFFNEGHEKIARDQYNRLFAFRDLRIFIGYLLADSHYKSCDRDDQYLFLTETKKPQLIDFLFRIFSPLCLQRGRVIFSRIPMENWYWCIERDPF